MPYIETALGPVRENGPRCSRGAGSARIAVRLCAEPGRLCRRPRGGARPLQGPRGQPRRRERRARPSPRHAPDRRAVRGHEAAARSRRPVARRARAGGTAAAGQGHRFQRLARPGAGRHRRGKGDNRGGAHGRGGIRSQRGSGLQDRPGKGALGDLDSRVRRGSRGRHNHQHAGVPGRLGLRVEGRADNHDARLRGRRPLGGLRQGERRVRQDRLAGRSRVGDQRSDGRA